MSELLEERKAKFLNYWEKKRANKRKFYLNYALGWGVLASSIAYLLKIKFIWSAFNLLEYLLYLIFWILGGLLWAHLQFRAQEKHYQKLKEESGNG